VNDQRFANRLSAAELLPGTFYVDETNAKITAKLLDSQTLPIASYKRWQATATRNVVTVSWGPGSAAPAR
jgi:hypothetical protein